MTRKDQPITQADVSKFVETEADFAFEMRVLNTLSDLGFSCQHGWTYRDPITDKIRQFDIRAYKGSSRQGSSGSFRLHLAVECKNLRDTSPLLVHAVKRSQPEAYHNVYVRAPNSFPEVKPISGEDSAYPPHELVGKATDQVARNHGQFVSSDREAFDKMSQSINSSYELVRESVAQAGANEAHSIIPFLVIPDGRLWQVAYSNDGSNESEPEQVRSTTLIISHSWSAKWGTTPMAYSISHLEIVTIGALAERTGYLEGSRGVFRRKDLLLG